MKSKWQIALGFLIVLIFSFNVFAQIAHFAGQAVPGFSLINCNASIFLINSSEFLPKGHEVTSIHLIIKSGSIINVHLQAIQVSSSKILYESATFKA